jgi:serine/threonine-protein kinase
MEGVFQPGTVLLEKYRVEGVLGRGGMGVVLRVTHLHLGEELAIKILRPDAGGGPEVHARFLREAQSAVRLRGEHVARVGDVGVLPGGAPYMVMEYLRGGDLSGELARRGALPPGEIVDYVLQACEALAEAHALGIVHRDIKPSNLFLTRRPDGSPLVKVLDFGISKAPIGSPGVLTRTDTVMGTPGYMSPEQMKASKDVDARSDIWALGIVLYECLNGRRPFDAETFSATVLRAATEPPPLMDPRLPRGLQVVILQCLEKDRAARFPSIAALAAALAPFARDSRSAGIIVERTAAMLQGPGASVAQAPRFGQAPNATTLSGSAGMMRARSTRRYAVGGVVVAVAAVVAVAVVSRVASHPGPDGGSGGSANPATPPGVGSGGAVTIDASATAQGAGLVPDAGEVVVATVVDAAAAPTGAETPAATPAESGRTAGDAKATAARCAELEVNQKWQDLHDCAGELIGLAGKDRSVASKAEEFRLKAVKETNASLAATKLKGALEEGNLREAQKQLKAIGTDSFYSAAASDAFHAAETKAVDENRRKAQALVAKNDCAGVKRLQVQLNTTSMSTSAVAGAVAVVAAKCVDRVAGAPGGPEVSHPPVGSNGPPNPPPPGDTQLPKGPTCDTIVVDDLMSQAANQFAAGFAKSALSLVVHALSCKQNDRMYRMAVTYACAAHDAAAAKLYYGRVSAQFQSAIVQRCQLENIALP